MKFTSRSGIVTDWTCKRKRYWQYEFDDKGIVRDESPLELFLGTVLHDSIGTLALQQQAGIKGDIDLIASTAQQQVYSALLERQAGEAEFQAVEFANEQAALIEAMLRGFHRHVWPLLLAQYPTIIHVEQEFTYPLSDDLTFMAKPDLIMADASGDTHYLEWKSTSSKREGWINSWTTAVQLHSSVKAVEHVTGTAPVDVTVVGLYKGYVGFGRQQSPLIYAYTRGGNLPFSSGEVRYDYAAGFKATGVWKLPGGVKEWVEKMPSEKLAEQFLMTPPIMINDSLVEAFFKQTLLRETEIIIGMEALKSGDPLTTSIVMDGTFPQNFGECSPSYGNRVCPYRNLCFSHVEDPLSQGYLYRRPHHQLELDQQNEVKE